MTSIVTKGRKSLASAALAIGITLGFASPAQAETITYTCEGQRGIEGMTVQGNWTVDIDFGARTVKFDSYPLAPAVITDREITFNYRDTSGRFWGRIDRLAGTVDVTRVYEANDRPAQIVSIEARCRRATTKI